MKNLPFAENDPDSSMSAWKEALSGTRQTFSERHLTAIARKSFLTLWSYPNVFTDEGRSAGKGHGKELCDLLVVFGNDILIFSDKHCEYGDHADVNVAWHRWYRRAIEKSAKQLVGAKAWLNRHSHRLFLDRDCEQSLPIKLPPPETRRIHLIAVARGSSSAAKKHWDSFGRGSSTSLVLNTTLVGDAHRDEPFNVGWPLGREHMIHVLDDESLGILLEELDTLPDFTEYLVNKEEAFARTDGDFLVLGEEDLLALYLMPTFGASRTPHFPPVEADALKVVREGLWRNLCSSKHYKLRKKSKQISYLWDTLIEFQTSHILEGSAYVPGGGGTMDQMELVLRKMAEEPRSSRVSLGASLERARRKKVKGKRFTSTVLGGPDARRAYVILSLPYDGDCLYDDYLASRRYQLATYSEGCLAKFPHLNEVVGIAMEPYKTKVVSVDYMLLIPNRQLLDADPAYKADLENRLLAESMWQPHQVQFGSYQYL